MSAHMKGLYLVMAGGDGFQSQIVNESQLDDAYLLTQWGSLDGIDSEQRADALENFHDDDQWTHTDVTGNGDRLKFCVSFEDGWVEVTRLPGEAIEAITKTAGPVRGELELPKPMHGVEHHAALSGLSNDRMVVRGIDTVVVRVANGCVFISIDGHNVADFYAETARVDASSYGSRPAGSAA